MKRIFTRLLWVFFALVLLAPPSGAVVTPVHPSSSEPDPATVKAAVDAFNNLSKKEKKAKIREVRKAIKEHKARKGKAEPVVDNTLLLVIITILIPPLGVYLHEGEINTRFWISLLLTILFYFPGLIYSLIVVLGTPKTNS